MVEMSQGMYKVGELGPLPRISNLKTWTYKEEFSKKANVKCPKTEEGSVESQESWKSRGKCSNKNKVVSSI